MALLSAARRPLTARNRRRQDQVSWLLGYLACLFVTLVLGMVAVQRISATIIPTPYPFALACFLFGCVVVVIRPVTGLYLIAGLSLIGDYEAIGSYPFTKNMSSPESILFVHPALSISPLEAWMGLLLFTWILHMVGSREWHVRRGQLFGPVMAFTGFLVLGLVWGLSRGGDMVIALSEIRPMLYLAILYPITTNLLTRRDQYVRLFNFLLASILVNAALSYRYMDTLSPAAKANPESIMQHSTPLIMNVVMILLVSLRLFHGGSWLKRGVLLLAMAPIIVSYLEVKRRAAIVGLLGGALVLLAVLYWTNRKRFMKLAPVLLVAAIGYTAVFWNSSSTLGFPAQAMKTVIAPDQISDRDRASNAYRDIETYNIKYTIRSAPLTGIGFGQPFLRPLPMPAIADFQLANYVTHNSVLWVWMKAGVGGFVAMLYLFGMAMRTGARSALRVPRGEYAALTATSTAFVLMYGLYTYVDISFDVKSMVLLSFAMAQIDSVRLIPDEPAEVEEPVALPELVGAR